MTNPLARHGGLTYLHLPVRDASATAAFFERVCGWRIERRDGVAVRFTDPDGFLIGGFGETTAPEVMVPYVYVDNITAAVAAAEESGGAVVEAIRREGDIHVARLRDPSGNVIGVWQFA